MHQALWAVCTTTLLCFMCWYLSTSFLGYFLSVRNSPQITSNWYRLIGYFRFRHSTSLCHLCAFSIRFVFFFRSNRWNCLVVAVAIHFCWRVESRYAYPLKNNVFIVEEDSSWASMPWTYSLRRCQRLSNGQNVFWCSCSWFDAHCHNRWKPYRKRNAERWQTEKQQAHRKNTRYRQRPQHHQRRQKIFI